MEKSDLIIALIIGGIIGWFGLGILKNLELEIKIWYWILLPIFSSFFCLGFLWIACFLGKKFLVIWQLSKFILVGVLNTFIDLGVLNLLILVSGIASGLPYSIFKGLSFIVAVTNSYFWNRFWTFEKSLGIKGKEYTHFLIISIIGFLINVGTASTIVNLIGPQFGLTSKIWANVGAIGAALVGMSWNFLGYKFIVFKK